MLGLGGLPRFVLPQQGAGFADSFDRADSATALGAPWAAVAGTWGISGNEAYFVNPAIAGIAVCQATPNGITECVMRGILNGATRGIPCLMFRSYDVNNYLWTACYGGQLDLAKIDGGGTTVLARVTPEAMADNTDYHLRVVAYGDNITVYLNGVQKIAYTLAGSDTKYSTYSRVGMRYVVAGTPANQARWNDFKHWS